MSLFGLLPWFRDDRPLVTLAQEAARRCEVAVWERIADRAGEMNHFQARGYIRARAGLVVRRHAELMLLGRPEIAGGARDKVVELALDASVLRAMEALRNRRVATVTPLRRAA